MHLIGEASRLIAVEINLESSSHHKQNYILLYQDESQQWCLLCGRLSSPPLPLCGQQHGIQSVTSFLLIWVFWNACMKKKILSVSLANWIKKKCTRANKLYKQFGIVILLLFLLQPPQKSKVFDYNCILSSRKTITFQKPKENYIVCKVTQSLKKTYITKDNFLNLYVTTLERTQN